MLASEFFERVKDGSLISSLRLREDEIAASLDVRDTDEFAARWMGAFMDVEAAKSRSRPDAASAALASKARELAYLQAFGRWRSADLAAYISDDVGLLVDAISGDCMDSRLNSLLNAYLEGRFPGGA